MSAWLSEHRAVVYTAVQQSYMYFSADKTQIVTHIPSPCNIYLPNTQAAQHLLHLHLLPDGPGTQGFSFFLFFFFSPQYIAALKYRTWLSVS